MELDLRCRRRRQHRLSEKFEGRKTDRRSCSSACARMLSSARRWPLGFEVNGVASESGLFRNDAEPGESGRRSASVSARLTSDSSGLLLLLLRQGGRREPSETSLPRAGSKGPPGEGAAATVRGGKSLGWPAQWPTGRLLGRLR